MRLGQPYRDTVAIWYGEQIFLTLADQVALADRKSPLNIHSARSRLSALAARQSRPLLRGATKDRFPPTLSNAAIARYMIVSLRFGLTPVVEPTLNTRGSAPPHADT